jgi:hypothetical protein
VPGTGLILSGVRFQIPGLDVTNWIDSPILSLKRGEDSKGRPPGTWIRALICHTSKGINTTGGPLPGFGPSVNAGERVARYWSSDGRNAGAHIVIDHDGKVFQTADIVTEVAYGCPKWNTGGVHLELYQGRNGEVFENQLGVCVQVIDFLTGTLSIQRQIPAGPYVGFSARLVAGDETATGVFGHRDLAKNRGAGDPGNALFNRLGAAGYESYSFDLGHEREEWRRRQRSIGMVRPDGIAGPATARAIRAAKSIPYIKGTRPQGLWIQRPGDELLTPVV